MSKVTNRTDDIMGYFDVEFFFGTQFDVEFVFSGPSLMWSLFLLAHSLMWSFFLLGPSLMWSLFFFGAQFDVEFVFFGPLFDVEFVFWRAVWGVPLRRNWDSGTRNQVSRTDFVQNPQPFTTDGGTLLACLPACVPACVPDSLTHSLSHAWRKQGSTWQNLSERAWLPGRGTREKDYAEPNWRMRTCAFSRSSRCPMMIMMMSAAIHCSVPHTHNIYKQMRIWFLAIISYSCASDSKAKVFVQFFLLACLPARRPAAHLSFCK